MKPAVRIVDFEPRHQAEAAELINIGLGEHFGEVDPSMNPDLYDIGASYGGAEFLIALKDETVVGTGALLTIEPSVGQVVRMHTAADQRRSGIATRIIEELERRARALGLRSLMLETNLDWEDAIAFYLRSGYEELGRNEEGIRFGKRLTD